MTSHKRNHRVNGCWRDYFRISSCFTSHEGGHEADIECRYESLFAAHLACVLSCARRSGERSRFLGLYLANVPALILIYVFRWFYSMAAIEKGGSPFRVDFCPTRTGQWRPVPSVQCRAGLAHLRSFATAAQITDNRRSAPRIRVRTSTSAQTGTASSDLLSRRKAVLGKHQKPVRYAMQAK